MSDWIIYKQQTFIWFTVLEARKFKFEGSDGREIEYKRGEGRGPNILLSGIHFQDKGICLLMRAEPSQPNHLLKVLSTLTLGKSSFQHTNFGGHIQTIATTQVNKLSIDDFQNG